MNATVKAYVALKLAGDCRRTRRIWSRACSRVRELGGLEQTNSFTRLYLALVGVVGWDMVPAVPPELMLLPTLGVHQHLRDVVVDARDCDSADDSVCAQAALARARNRAPGRVVPRPVQEHVWCLKLAPRSAGVISFLALDRGLKLYERLPGNPAASGRCDLRTDGCSSTWNGRDGLAAIYPAMMNSIFALMALGHSPAIR